MNRRETMIVRQIMRGLNPKPYTQKQFNAFAKKHRETITWVDDIMPSHLLGKFTSIGILGAVGKGVLWYGQAKMKPFCEVFSSGEFNGAGDPAHILWLWLTGRAKYDSKMAYRKTISAIRAYVVGTQLMRMRNGYQVADTMHAAKTDLFEWDSTFTIMLKRQDNKSGKDFKVASTEDARLEAEVEEALASMRK